MGTAGAVVKKARHPMLVPLFSHISLKKQPSIESRCNLRRAGLILALVLLSSIQGATAQCPGYDITTSTGTIIPGTSDVGNHCDNCLTPVTFPFPIFFMGTTYMSGMVSSNGNLQLGTPAGAAPSSGLNECLPSPSQITGPAIFPHWDDMISVNPGFGTFSAISGTAPNRTFVLEWRTQYFPGTGSADFEIVFYEGLADFDVIYGNVTGGGAGATVGVQASASGTAVQYECNTGGIGAGLKLHFAAHRCFVCAGGDMNGDGFLNGLDVGPWVRAFLGLDTDPVHICEADLNHNGAVDSDDMDRMVNMLALGNGAAIATWINSVNGLDCGANTDYVIMLKTPDGTGANRRLDVAAKRGTEDSACGVRVKVVTPSGGLDGFYDTLPGGTTGLIIVPPNCYVTVRCMGTSGNCVYSFNPNY